MSKGGIIVLIVAALVFCGLGFVIGQVVQASGSVGGSESDPVVTQSYVDKRPTGTRPTRRTTTIPAAAPTPTAIPTTTPIPTTNPISTWK